MSKLSVVSFAVDSMFIEKLDELCAKANLKREDVIRSSLGLFSEALENARLGKRLHYSRDKEIGVLQSETGSLEEVHQPQYIQNAQASRTKQGLLGKEILRHVPSYTFNARAKGAIADAKAYISENNLMPPSIIIVHSDGRVTGRFFWGEKGLSTLQFAEKNHSLFPSLNSIYDAYKDSIDQYVNRMIQEEDGINTEGRVEVELLQ
jgi:hypothetical protein